MRVTKPAWVEHTADKNARTPIYSISIHPDGTRLATSGMDRKIKIWSTVPILDPEAEKDEANSKLLCTMSEHTGSVLCVRWAHHGRCLASGSDDSVAMIWALDSLWGSDEVNVENWKPITRLVAHVADIIDLAWSRDDSMLASVGLDGKVWIWDGSSFERIQGIDAHNGFVKGVCWDPVGKFLATQSDDKTVKIWDTATWQLVKSVSEPFADSGTTTFYRRLSWSPDGAFIAASNAKNGPVFVAAVIERNEWESDISFVGHGNTIQVASFNPRLFFGPDDPHTAARASSMLALGANDFSISIWRNTIHKPLIVLHDIFGRDLLDLCWSDDGLTLYGCSHDGTICAVSFKATELPDLGPAEDTIKVLKELGYNPDERRSRAPAAPNGFTPSMPSSNVITQVAVRRTREGDNRRLIKRNDPNARTAPLSRTGLQAPVRTPIAPPASPGAPSAFADAPLQPLDMPHDAQASRDIMFQGASEAFDDQVNRLPAKRKASVHEETRAPKGRMMGASKPTTDVREIRPARQHVAAGPSTLRRTLAPPVVQNAVRATRDADKTYVEATNAVEPSQRNKIAYSSNGQDMWLDYVSSAVLNLVLTGGYAAAACEDGTVLAYSPAGRHLLNAKLAAPVAEMAVSKSMLALITTDCELRVYDVRSGRALFSPTSMAHLLESDGGTVQLNELSVRSNGTVVISTSQPAAYLYDRAKSAFIPLVTPFQLAGSPLLTTAPRASSRNASSAPSASLHTATSSTSPVSEIESLVLEQYRRQLPNGTGTGAGAGTNAIDTPEKPAWWDVAMTLQHIEMRVRAAELLASKEEYKGYLKEYAKKVGQEGFRTRAEEIVRELVGPLYHMPGRTTSWEPEVIGLQKRDLAKMVLGAFAAFPALNAFATEWQASLRKAAEEDRAMNE